MVLLAFAHLFLTAMLLVFGFIVGWKNDPGHPLIGSSMIAAAILIFVFGPRLAKRATGRDLPAPPPPPPFIL